jgi:hypothetical protein
LASKIFLNKNKNDHSLSKNTISNTNDDESPGYEFIARQDLHYSWDVYTRELEKKKEEATSSKGQLKKFMMNISKSMTNLMDQDVYGDDDDDDACEELRRIDSARQAFLNAAKRMNSHSSVYYSSSTSNATWNV